MTMFAFVYKKEHISSRKTLYSSSTAYTSSIGKMLRTCQYCHILIIYAVCGYKELWGIAWQSLYCHPRTVNFFFSCTIKTTTTCPSYQGTIYMPPACSHPCDTPTRPACGSGTIRNSYSGTLDSWEMCPKVILSS